LQVRCLVLTECCTLPGCSCMLPEVLRQDI
jgi:hypothetical protein